MKKLFMTVALVFATTIGFADGNSSKTTSKEVVCVMVDLSCDEVGFVCGSTTEKLVELAEELDEWVCN